MLLENSGSEEKLNVQPAAQRALRAAASGSDAGTRPWAEPAQGARREVEMRQGQLLPFHLQDGMGF